VHGLYPELVEIKISGEKPMKIFEGAHAGLMKQLFSLIGVG
jgi:hypothetical protein